MKRQFCRHGIIDTTIENADYYTKQNKEIDVPSFIKKSDYELIIKEFFEMKELFLNTKVKVNGLNRKLAAFKHITNVRTVDAFTSMADNLELGVEKSALDINKKPKTGTPEKKKKNMTKESSAENSKGTSPKNNQTSVLNKQEQMSIAMSSEFTQDELAHIQREWSSHSQNAETVWKVARRYPGTAYERKYFEIYDQIDFEVEGPEPGNYKAYKARICAIIEAAMKKASLPNELLMNFKAKGMLLNYRRRLETIVDYLDNFYDADMRFIATLIEIALHMSYKGTLYTDTKCLALIKYASSFLKLPVTYDKFLDKLLYFVEFLFKLLKRRMPLRAYSNKDCLKTDEKPPNKKSGVSPSPSLTVTNLVIADCRYSNNKLLDKNNEYMHVDSFRYSYLSDLKALSETNNANQKLVEFGAFNRGVKECLRSFNFYHLMLNETFTSRKSSASSAHEREHDDRVDKKMSIEFEMFMCMMNRLKCFALILLVMRLDKDYDGLDVMVDSLSKNPFAPDLSLPLGSHSNLKNAIQAISKNQNELLPAKEFYKSLSRAHGYDLSATFEDTKNDVAESIKNVYPRSFFLGEREEAIQKLSLPKKVYGKMRFGVYMESFLEDYEKYK